MEKIRNFCIIAHIDHGKSTLADRFLEITSTVSKEKMQSQYLDSMDLERERGITIKMQPVRMEYNGCVLNLIDTPGHVDFSYEVSRSLAAVEGAILLVDATKGIQAQTIANLELAKKQNLTIIPAINKIDSPAARLQETQQELSYLLGVEEKEIFLVSAKTGTNVNKLLDEVIEKVPAPKGQIDKPFRSLIFGSKYDSFLGVIAYVRVIDGQIKQGENIYLLQTKSQSDAKEVGHFKPDLKKVAELNTGEIGYIATGIKEPGKIRVGDTIAKTENIEPLPGYKEPKPMVFASLYPQSSEDFDLLKEALGKLKLKDASLTYEMESQETLGRGFRCGFLGSLHAEIVSERLSREFGLDLVISRPSVVYKLIDQKFREIFIYSPSDWPSETEIKEIQEPWAKLEIITPQNYLGQVMDLSKRLHGTYIKSDYFSSGKVALLFEVPLRDVIAGFYDNLKSVTQGFSSMNYEILDYRKGDLVKMDILVSGRKEEALSKIVRREDGFDEGKKMVEKLKEVLPAQLYAVALQACVSGKVIARETIGAKRRDVTAPLYGGDFTRKRKLLERQKKGKKDLKEKGDIRIPQEVFLEMFKS
jgi:GTP-binding protein LepA